MSTPARLSALACGVAVFSLVDPRFAALGPWSALICLGCLVASARNGIQFDQAPAIVGIFAGVLARTGYNLEADAQSYMANVTSLLQDFDLDIGNQIYNWTGHMPSRGPAGYAITPHPVGNAFVWALPVLLAHAYVCLTHLYAANFYSPPYFGAVIVTNLVIAISGAIALARVLARSVGDGTAALAVIASILMSPVVYYLTVQSVMAHGLSFGLACWVFAMVDRAALADTPSAWRWVGVVLGVATVCRFQALVLVLIVPLVAPSSLRVLTRRACFIAPPAILICVPQIVSWFRTFGWAFRVPQGEGFFSFGSPRWPDTLFSADRGLFNWHPMLLLGLFGLLLVRRTLWREALAGLAIFATSVWINGTVGDFDGGDAFGGRRYDIVIPFLAIGLARLLDAGKPFLARRPLALPAFMFALAAVWNFSFIGFYRDKQFRVAAPIDELAAAQARHLRDITDTGLGWLGPRMRYRIYDAFVGLYTYRDFHPGGDFDVATLEPRFMRAGWSNVQWWEDGSVFRYLLYPKACIAIPIDEPFDLRGFVLARSPKRIADQRMTLTLNGQTLTEAALPADWTQIHFEAPRRLWIPGENLFCMIAAKKRPGDQGGDLAYSAAVIRVQLP